MQLKKHVLAIAVALAASMAAPAFAAEPTVEGAMVEASYIIGLRLGSGVLHSDGQDLRFRVSGITIFSVGVAAGNFEGKVLNLNNINDFPGHYTVTELGGAYVLGANVQRWTNDKGVVIELSGVEVGAELRLGGGGLAITMIDEPKAPVVIQPAQEIRYEQRSVAPVAETLRLDTDVHFSFGRAALSDQGMAVIDGLLMKSTAGGARIDLITVEGHADRIGSDRSNHELAADRARAVGEYLVAHGVPESKLDLTESGEDGALVSCDGVSGQRLVNCLAPNRRADIVVISSRPAQ